MLSIYFFTIFCVIIFVFLLTDALLRKAYACPSFQGYSFVSSLLVLLGLIKVCFVYTYPEESAKLQKRLFFHCLMSFVSVVLSLGGSEWGQSEACASGSRPPPRLGACCSTGLLSQGEHGCVGGLHVPVRTWQNEPISRQHTGTKHCDHHFIFRNEAHTWDVLPTHWWRVTVWWNGFINFFFQLWIEKQNST